MLAFASLLFGAVTLAGNVTGNGTISLGPAAPTAVTQICSICSEINLGNVKVFPNGCLEFPGTGLQAPGPFSCTNLCGTFEDYCIVNGTRLDPPAGPPGLNK